MMAAKEFTDLEWEAIVEECFEAWTELNDSVRGTTMGDLEEWFESNRGADPVADLTDDQVEALARAILRKCEGYGLWYAVQRDSEDPWDDGYYTEAEAINAANRQGCDIIAVIDITHADPFCIRELHRGEDF